MKEVICGFHNSKISDLVFNERLGQSVLTMKKVEKMKICFRQVFTENRDV